MLTMLTDRNAFKNSIGLPIFASAIYISPQHHKLEHVATVCSESNETCRENKEPTQACRKSQVYRADFQVKTWCCFMYQRNFTISIVYTAE